MDKISRVEQVTISDAWKKMVVYGGLLCLVGIFLVAGLWQPVHHDEAVFLTIGREMQQGKLPYRDLFDHKTPGLYWIASWFQGEGVERVMQARLLVLTVNVLSASIIFLLLRRQGLKWLSGVGAGIFILLMIGWHGTYFLAEPFMVLGLLIVWWMSEQFTGKEIWLGIGLVMGVLLVIKQTAIVFLLPVGYMWWRQESEKIWKLILFGLGWLLLFGYTVWWLWHQGIWSEAIEQIVWFNLHEYQPYTIVETVQQSIGIISPVLVILLVIGLLAKVNWRTIFLPLAGLAVLMPVVLSRPYHHYWLLTAPFLVLGFMDLLKLKPQWRWLGWSQVIILIFWVGVKIGISEIGFREEQVRWWVVSCTEVSTPAGYLLSGCPPEKFFFRPDNVRPNYMARFTGN